MSEIPFNLRRLELISVQLAVYCALYGSLSAAAKKSHLSVSGASHKLNELEKTLGHQIFDRHRRGMAPTPAGKRTLGHCARLLFAAHGLIASSLTTCEDDGLRGLELRHFETDAGLDGLAPMPLQVTLPNNRVAPVHLAAQAVQSGD